MKVLFTGDYLPDYNRTSIIRKGLKQLGHEVTEIPFKKLTGELKSKIKEVSNVCDFVFMPSFTHKEVRTVRKIVGQSKAIIFDPLISRYLTKVFDYKLVSRYSLSAVRNYYRDKIPMNVADFVVTDTIAHRDYFHKTFRIPLEKMGVLYIGNDFDYYFPKKIKTNSDAPFRVGFYGGFIPLQGVMRILEVAKMLSSHHDIEFHLIGSGFEFEKAKNFVSINKLKNVNLPGWVQETQLPDEINQFDLALGIFGDTEKSRLVIPNKIYHYGACAKAVITQESLAIHELFKHDENIQLVQAEAHEITKTILDLKSNPQKREKLGQNIYNLLKGEHSAVQVAQKLVDYHHGLVRKT